MSARNGRSAENHGRGPFSRPLAVDEVPDDGLEISIEANPDERAAIATEVGIPAVNALSAMLRISRLHGGRLQVDGQLAARVTQVCVVSLEPFESDVAQPIEVTFAPAKASLPARNARSGNDRPMSRRAAEALKAVAPAPVEGPEGDPPDPIVDGRIDLGSIAVEFLTLALDFYPRKPGVEFSGLEIAATDDQTPSAFAALERFKDRP